MEMKGQSQQQPLRQTAKEVIAANVKVLNPSAGDGS